MEIDIFEINGVKVANIYNNSSIGFLGIFCLNGYIFENKDSYGVAHFVEHCMFSGTKTRTWKDINQGFAKIGAKSNAYTSSDEVCYHVTTANEHFKQSAEILMDVFFNSTYDPKEIEKERKVILEEKKMYDDDPSSAFSTECGKFLHPSYGHNAIGTEENIRSINRSEIVTYLRNSLGQKNIMVVYCGNVPSDEIKTTLEKLIPVRHDFTKRDKLRNSNDNILWNPEFENTDKIKLIYERENIEQAQILGFMNGLSMLDLLKFEEMVIMCCLGGGEYSMLYERIREELGLCYSVGAGSDVLYYPDVAIGKIYGMIDAKNISKFIGETEKIFETMKTDGINPDIFECAKNSLVSSVLMSVETSRGKGSFLTKRVFYNKPITIEDYVNKIRAVTLDSCNAFAKTMLDASKIKWAVMVNKKEDLC